MIKAGLCGAMARAAVAPRPLGLQPVMRTTFPVMWAARVAATSVAVESLVKFDIA
jgi:hypothetical protein